MAKKKGEPGSLPQSLDAVMALANKTYGHEVGVRGIKFPAVQRYQSGIFGIDFITGGGYPIGRFTKLRGWESSGKTTVTLKAVAELQRYCSVCGYLACDCPKRGIPKTVFMDIERALDPEWATSLGVDLNYVYIVSSDYAEQAIDVADMSLRSGDCGLLVVDSLAALTPLAEVNSSTEDQQQGLAARIINKALRKFTMSLSGVAGSDNVKPTILLINQFRHKIGVFFGNPEVEPGGFNQNFCTSIHIRLTKGDYGKDKEDEKVTWQEIKARADKNKTAPARGLWQFKIWARDYGEHVKGEINEEDQVLKSALDNQILEEASKGKSHSFVWKGAPGGEDLKASSKPAFARLLKGIRYREDLKGDLTFWDVFRAQLLQHMAEAPEPFQFINPRCRADDPPKPADKKEEGEDNNGENND